jgi:hypothetical protein
MMMKGEMMFIGTLKSTLIMAMVLSSVGVKVVDAGQDEAAPEAKKVAVDEKTIRALIVDLGNESFEKREAAQKRLAGVGGPAIKLLNKAAKESTDQEVRDRVTELSYLIQEIGLHLIRAEFYHDFRKKGLPNESFRANGPNAAKRLKSETEGLRMTLPAEKDVALGAAGVATQFKLKGDFEITVAYEILRADPPPEGWGAGFEVFLMTDTVTKEAIAFDRRMRPDGRDVYSCSRNTTNTQGNRDFTRKKDMPAKGKSGQIRITRLGSKTAISVQEEAGKGFRVVYRLDLGPEDLAMLRLAANPGGVATAVDLRVHDLRVRCSDADAINPLGGAKVTAPNERPD